MNKTIFNVFVTRDLVSRLLRAYRSELSAQSMSVIRDKDLACRLGIHPVEFSRLLRGVITMSLPVFLTLCQELKCLNLDRLNTILEKYNLNLA